MTFTNTSGQTLRDLDKWRTQNALLAEMVKAAEMSAKLSNPGTSAGPSGTTPSSSLAFQVLSVDGVDDKLTAVVTLTNGTTFKAREGLTIPGLGKVKSISRDEVLVTTKAGPRLLDFAPKGTLSGVR
ncbi:type IV pilus biogenesis protein PilP [Cupriavidus necator]|uniref:type IV pilus biogenesis protein PilP n=1 Tax=Cupriavidus necator TaxID=106590 RepID=UPI003ECDD199